MKQTMFIVIMILALGFIGNIDAKDTIRTSQIDNINKHEVIKDIQLKCVNGTITDSDYCMQYLK